MQLCLEDQSQCHSTYDTDPSGRIAALPFFEPTVFTPFWRLSREALADRSSAQVLGLSPAAVRL